MGTRILYRLHTEKQVRVPNVPLTLPKPSVFEDSLEKEMASAHKSYNIPKESSLLAADTFITGAGAVIFHRKTKRVVLVVDEREDQMGLGWFLPKGRKDVGESFAEAAVREGEEEGGYPCRLLAVPVPTRAPKKVADGNFLSTEPIYMHNWAIPKKRSWPQSGIYTCFWYACEVTDEDVEKVEQAKKEKMANKAQESLMAAGESGKVFMDYHELRYRSELFGYEEAQRLIDESIDSTVFGCVLSTAIELVNKLDEMEARQEARKAEVGVGLRLDKN